MDANIPGLIQVFGFAFGLIGIIGLIVCAVATHPETDAFNGKNSKGWYLALITVATLAIFGMASGIAAVNGYFDETERYDLEKRELELTLLNVQTLNDNLQNQLKIVRQEKESLDNQLKTLKEVIEIKSNE